MGNENMWDKVDGFVVPLNKQEKEFEEKAEKQLIKEEKIGFGATDDHLRRKRMLVRERARELCERAEYEKLKKKYG